MTVIRNKGGPEDVLLALQGLPNPLKDVEEDPSYNPMQIEVFTQTLLFLGSKTFSHSFAGISKFLKVRNLIGSICGFILNVR
ncbi:UNVERIFIED_CONTAM: hypothetical protein GTU68_043349 [Idotea baltica]|nr:hypothetical protein [Idotea baltica]